MRREEMGHGAKNNQPWAWPELDLALIGICPTWQ